MRGISPIFPRHAMQLETDCENAVQITPVVLAGGRGSRLWPITSPKRPKPFLKIFSRYSLLQQTIMRVKDFDAPLIVTEEAYLTRLQAQLKALKCEPKAILTEPVGRNTAPAIIAAALSLYDENALMLVVPSDHVIDKAEHFCRDVRAIASYHKGGSLTVLGIPARRASAHFGYIVPKFCNDAEEGENGAGPPIWPLQNFIEKPDKTKARMLIAEQAALWHSGIFLCRAQDLCDMAKAHAPEIYNGVQEAVLGISVCLPAQGGVLRIKEFPYINLPSISIDYTIMERVQGCFMGQLRVKWLDIGTWGGLMRALFLRFKRM